MVEQQVVCVITGEPLAVPHNSARVVETVQVPVDDIGLWIYTVKKMSTIPGRNKIRNFSGLVVGAIHRPTAVPTRFIILPIGRRIWPEIQELIGRKMGRFKL